MLIIGLTGSIASGKSTVSSILAGPPHHLPIIDADLIARQVVEPGTSGYAKIVQYFGPSTPDLLLPTADSMPERGPDGKGRPLNRRALGRRVFGDDTNRKRDRDVLNGIVHPAVRWSILKSIGWHYLTGQWAVVLDVPLLFEARMDVLCGTVMVVAVSDAEIQMRRLMDRDEHLSREEAEDRVRSQASIEVKTQQCRSRGPTKGIVLSNDGTKDELKADIDRALRHLGDVNPKWWTWLLLGFPPLGVVVGMFRSWQNIQINKQWRAQASDRERERVGGRGQHAGPP